MLISSNYEAVWMYGFPTRKHYYADRSLIKSKYGDSRHSNDSSSASISSHKLSNNSVGLKTSYSPRSPVSRNGKNSKDDGTNNSNGYGPRGEITPYVPYAENPYAIAIEQRQTGFAEVSKRRFPPIFIRDCAIPEEDNEEDAADRDVPLIDISRENSIDIGKDDRRKAPAPVVVLPITSMDCSPGALLEAVKNKDPSVACDILGSIYAGKLPFDVNESDDRGRTILSYAVTKNYLPLLDKMFQFPGVDANKCDLEGNTPLHFAAQAGQVEAVGMMLNTCTDVEIDARNQNGITPLMKAALQGRTRCAKLLLFAGASATMRDTGRGLRAEQWARFCGRYVCAEMIEKYARNQLLSKNTSYGSWGNEAAEQGPHFENGRLIPPPIGVQKMMNESCARTSFKAKLKKAFQVNPLSWATTASEASAASFSLVSQLTSAALCASSPILPISNRNKAPSIVKSLMKPLVPPQVQITPVSDEEGEMDAEEELKQQQQRQRQLQCSASVKSTRRKSQKSYFSKLRRNSTKSAD